MKEKLTVLSIRQPWASLLLSGEDWCENRTWTTKHRGPLWIHASTKVEKSECETYGIDPKSLPTGAIIGCVDVVDVLDAEQDMKFPLRIADLAEQFGLDMDVGPDFIVGPFCWIVTNGKKLIAPIPVKGKLNLWTYEPPANHQLALEDPSPLIATVIGPSEIEEKLLIEGQKETVVFRASNDGVGMYFKKRERSRIAKPPGSWNYRDGEPYYRAGCERAWELFPERFTRPTDT